MRPTCSNNADVSKSVQAHYDARVVSMTTLGDVTEDGTQETEAILINEQEAQHQAIRGCSSSFVFYTR